MRAAGEWGGYKSIFSGRELGSACSLSNSILYTEAKLPHTIEAISRA
jgi:hypothetical protein